ncbi:MAG: prephenate dehydratase [Flavobacteriales bacterium]
MTTKKIAIQGIKGSFHDEAAHTLFSSQSIKLIECFTFKEVAKAVIEEQADYGVMAIENSIAGSILPNYNLLTEYNLQITDELYMPINHYVMAQSGQKLEQLKEVRSHPMALMQCENYFEPYATRMVEVADTALAAKEITIQNLKGIAAIAPKRSAYVYELEILGEKIQTVKTNFTRFFVVQKKALKQIDFNKVSLKFKVSHESGSLAQILNQIAFKRINMSKIQSVPVIEEPWNYSFFVDLILDKNSEFDLFLKSIHPLVKELKILGKYQNKKE